MLYKAERLCRKAFSASGISSIIPLAIIVASSYASSKVYISRDALGIRHDDVVFLYQ